MKLTSSKIYRQYLKLLKIHGDPKKYWPSWCGKRKSPQLREEIVIGAILTQRTNWGNVEMALTNCRNCGILSIKGIYNLSRASHSFVQPAPRVSVAYSHRDNIQSFSKGGVRGALEKGDAPLFVNLDYLSQLIRPTGFYRQKAKTLWEFCRMVIEEYKGLRGLMKEKTTVAREKLLSLWGIGPETADSILLYSLDKPSFVIDEYTRRLVTKKKLARDLDYDFLKSLFEHNLPPDFRLYQDFHALIVVSERGEREAKMR